MSLLQFEVTNPDGTLSRVTVLDMFVHFYTKEYMRQVRIESYGEVTGNGFATYEVLNEFEYNELIKRRVVNDQT